LILLTIYFTYIVLFICVYANTLGCCLISRKITSFCMEMCKIRFIFIFYFFHFVKSKISIVLHFKRHTHFVYMCRAEIFFSFWTNQIFSLKFSLHVSHLQLTFKELCTTMTFPSFLYIILFCCEYMCLWSELVTFWWFNLFFSHSVSLLFREMWMMEKKEQNCLKDYGREHYVRM
jgi:hypothetical protein